jgi:molybdopterin-binding protein
LAAGAGPQRNHGAVRPQPALGALIFDAIFLTDFKEELMSIQAINVRNQFRGKVREIIHGDVVSEVDVETPWGIVTSVITSRSVKDLGLVVGSEVVALVKSTEVSIAKL